MGKNQQYKQQQRAKAASHASAGPNDEGSTDGMVDGTFHSPEWHAARLASLQTSSTVTWEEWKAQRKEEARKQQEMEGFEEKRMREYREQLDKERENKLARGRNHADKRDKIKKKDKGKDKEKGKDKDKDKSKKRKSKKRKSSDSDSSDSDDSSDKKSKKKKKAKKSKASDGDLSSASEEKEGPVRLSSFFTGGAGDLSDSDEDKPRQSTKGNPLRDALEEAKRRAEIGAHMVAEVKRADELGGRQRAPESVKEGRWDKR